MPYGANESSNAFVGDCRSPPGARAPKNADEEPDTSGGQLGIWVKEPLLPSKTSLRCAPHALAQQYYQPRRTGPDQRRQQKAQLWWRQVDDVNGR